MSKKSSATSKNSFFMIFLLLSVVIIGVIVIFFQSGSKITTRSRAATSKTKVVSSLNQIPGVIKTVKPEETMILLIDPSIYRTIYEKVAKVFCDRTRKCTGPYVAKYIASQRIGSSMTYIFDSGQQVNLDISYYFYAYKGSAGVTSVNCTVNNKPCPEDDKRLIMTSLFRDVILRFLEGYDLELIAINNDTSYLYITFKVKALPIPTPTPCADSVPPASPGNISHSGTNPYNFRWGASGCTNIPKAYFFRRYNGSIPSGSEPNCPAGNTTSGSCWRKDLSISNIAIDFNNNGCIDSGTKRACYVFVWAKNTNNQVSRTTEYIVNQP